jgi:Cu-processing system ATP-binding protein
MGLVLPDSGRILVKGEDISKNHLYRSTIGYMPQINRSPDHLTVVQLFTMMKKMRFEVTANAYDEELFQAFNISKMNVNSLISQSN